MSPERPPISETELEVLRALWEHGPGTVRDLDSLLRARRKRWAYTTVLTLLRRLCEKGYVKANKRGVAHVFRATISRERLVERRLADLASELCDGDTSPIVHALVKGRRFTSDEIQEFRELLDDLAEGEST